MFFHCRQEKKYNFYQDSFVVFRLFGFWFEKSVATGVSSMAVFVVHARFYSRVREKTKLLGSRSCTQVSLSYCIFIVFIVSFNGGH